MAARTLLSQAATSDGSQRARQTRSTGASIRILRLIRYSGVPFAGQSSDYLVIQSEAKNPALDTVLRPDTRRCCEKKIPPASE